MALSVSAAVSAIQAEMDALAPTATESDRMTALVDALFTHIKANLVVNSSVIATGVDPQGGSVSSTGTATSTSVT